MSLKLCSDGLMLLTFELESCQPAISGGGSRSYFCGFPHSGCQQQDQIGGGRISACLICGIICKRICHGSPVLQDLNPAKTSTNKNDILSSMSPSRRNQQLLPHSNCINVPQALQLHSIAKVSMLFEQQPCIGVSKCASRNKTGILLQKDA